MPAYCRFKSLPAAWKLLIGAVCLVIGVPVFLLPIPLGLLLMLTGGLFILSALRREEALWRFMDRRSPRLHRRLRRWLARCE